MPMIVETLILLLITLILCTLAVSAWFWVVDHIWAYFELRRMRKEEEEDARRAARTSEESS